MVIQMKTGFSYYFGTPPEKSKEIFKKAIDANMEYVFTSLHIPEEQVEDYRGRVLEFIRDCRDANLKFMIDVSPHTLEKLGCENFEDLKALEVDYLRLDFGFTNEEIVKLSKTFYIVFNASTHGEKDIALWKELGADFSRFLACHNFYPKPLTALSMKRVKEVNKYLNAMGILTMGFVSGDKDFRGPLYAGLPTVEKHRNGDVFYNMLELYHKTGCHVVLFGDVDVTDEVWQRVKEYNAGYVSLRADIEEPYTDLKNMLHHDRADSSSHVLRSVESRFIKREVLPVTPAPERKKGDIFISNKDFLRYEGEVEIARKDLEVDSRVNIIGRIHKDDTKYMKYIVDGFGFMLK